jgi:hypothetical protein
MTYNLRRKKYMICMRSTGTGRYDVACRFVWLALNCNGTNSCERPIDDTFREASCARQWCLSSSPVVRSLHDPIVSSSTRWAQHADSYAQQEADDMTLVVTADCPHRSQPGDPISIPASARDVYHADDRQRSVLLHRRHSRDKDK